jgi:hypothetical protein
MTSVKLPSTTILTALLIGVSGVLLWSVLTNGHDWGGDFAGYILQAQSLVEGAPGNFIEANRFTVRQSSSPMAPVSYPWGFPVLLAPLYAGFGLNMLALKSAGVVCFLLFLVLLAVGFRERHSGLWLLALIGFFALNPTLLAFSDSVLSDIPFLLFSTLTVVLTGAVVVRRRRLISPAWDRVTLGASAAVAFSIRTNGILLLAALAVAQIVVLTERRRGTRRAGDRRPGALADSGPRQRVPVRGLGLLPYASFVAMTVLWRGLLPDSNPYPRYLAMMSVAGLRHNLGYYARETARIFDGVPCSYVVYAASVPLVVVGVVRQHRSAPHIIAYAALTILLYLLWPASRALRFLFPVLPFYASFAVTGLAACQGGATPTARRLRQAFCLLPAVLVLSSFACRSVTAAYGNLVRNREAPSGPFNKTSTSMFSFIRAHTEPESIVIFFKPRVMRMMTGRNALRITQPDQMDRGDYLCLRVGGHRDQVSPDTLKRLTQQGAARRVYGNRGFELYRLGPRRRAPFPLEKP